MNKQRFTPGPWRTGAGDFPTIYDRNHDKVAHCLMRPEDENGDGQLTRLANAKLVSAAPDLLAALEIAEGRLMCIDAQKLDTVARNDDVIDRIRAAIAKAKGE